MERAVALAEATRQLAIDALAHGVDLCEADRKMDPAQPRTPGSTLTQNQLKTMQLRCMDSVLVEKELLLGRCDLAFRASRCSTQHAIQRWNHLLEESYQCRVGFTPHDTIYSYGVLYSMEQKANTAVARFRKAGEMAEMLFEMMGRKYMLTRAQNSSTLGAPLTPCKTTAEAENRLKRAINTTRGDTRQILNNTERTHFVSFALGMKNAHAEGTKAWKQLRKIVQEHVAKRTSSGVCYLHTEFLGEDCIFHLAQFLEHGGVAACMLTGRDLRSVSFFRRQIPHLSIRKLPGMFPHAANGRTCVVSKKTVSRVVIDLSVCGARRADSRTSQQTLQHKNPEPVPSGRDARLAHKVDLNERNKRMAPEEACEDGMFRKRVPHSLCFSEPIVCTLDVVYADNHQIVRTSTGDSIIHLPRFQRTDGAPHSTHVALDDVPYPACMSFYVTDLTSQHAGRKFKLRVQGRTTAKDTDKTPVTLEAFSNEFAVVSTKRVAESSASGSSKAART
jgi:hypothetical protein